MPRFNKILPPEDSAELETLVDKEATREEDPKETRAEGDRKIIGSTVKAPVANTPSKHADVPCTKHAAEAKILNHEDDADLESLVDEEEAREEDPDVIQETRDAAAEGDRKVIVRIVKAPVIGSEEDKRLLEEVATNWTCGKSCSQTARCTSAIRNCLVQGMKQVTIADYVAYHAVPLEDQAVEFERIKAVARRIKKSLKESGEGAASKGVPYQRRGAVLVRGDALEKSVEAAMASLSISSKVKDADDATQSQGSPNLTTTNQVKNEQHWMVMWKNARAELKQLREELKGETDEEVMDELKSDIDGLKKKRDEWAVLLGIKE